VPLNRVRFSVGVAPATNTLPWWPKDSQLTSDCGPPDCSVDVGAAKSGSVSSLTASKVLLIVLIAKRTTTPLRIAIVSTSSRVTATTAETRGGATRSSWRIRNRISLRMS
jgi:hypothetical protein